MIYPQPINLSHSNELSRLDRSKHPPKLQVLIPLYIYPNWYDKDKYLWKQVIIAAKKVQILAIINPNNGPDRAPPNTDYQRGIQDLRQAGVKIVGYVPSNYAKRDFQAVRADIDIYAKYFKIDGIFIDEMTSNLESLNYYRQLYQHIKSLSPQYLTIVNPGTDVAENYISQPVADITVIFENTQKVWATYHPPMYTSKYSPQHFAALIHTTPNRKLMKSILDRSKKYQLGYIYITDDRTDTANHNPWDSLPKYWQAQINYIQKLNSE
jgi:Spherulation-specific family 4